MVTVLSLAVTIWKKYRHRITILNYMRMTVVTVVTIYFRLIKKQVQNTLHIATGVTYETRAGDHETQRYGLHL